MLISWIPGCPSLFLCLPGDICDPFDTFFIRYQNVIFKRHNSFTVRCPTLKAIAVGGNQEIPVFDRARLKECNKKIYHACSRKKQTDVIEDYVEEIKVVFRSGGIPVKNWQGGVFDPGEQFAESLRGARMGFCSCCPFSDTESMYNAKGERHILWEHWGPMGTNCLIDNVEALHESFSLCQRYGLDCISTGSVLAFAMECYEKGLLSNKDTGGIDLTWGNHQAMGEMVNQIGENLL